MGGLNETFLACARARARVCVCVCTFVVEDLSTVAEQAETTVDENFLMSFV